MGEAAYDRAVSRILLVEDEPRTRERMARALEEAPDVTLVGVAGDLAAGREAFDRLRPEVLLTDLGLPDGSGLELIAHARTAMPDAQVMVVTVFGDERNVIAAIEAGAAGYLLKDGTPDEIAAAVSELQAGGSPISPSIARHLLRRFQQPEGDGVAEESDPGLSAREREVLDLVARGFSSPEIAKLLELSPHTVKTHVRHIYEKLEVSSRGEAVYQAARRGLIEIDD